MPLIEVVGVKLRYWGLVGTEPHRPSLPGRMNIEVDDASAQAGSVPGQMGADGGGAKGPSSLVGAWKPA